jgi:M6 family metalloprotease-like protein
MTSHGSRFDRISRTVLLFLILCFPTQLLAVPARDASETVFQPDGSAISIRQFGDEWGNGHRTLDGFTIMRDPSNGIWKYAEEDANGDLRHSPLIVGRDRPVGIHPGLAPKSQRAAANGASGSQSADQNIAAAANLGSQPLLVIFADFTPSVRASSTAATLYNKFFGATSSVKHYYETVSYGNFSITPAPETNVALSGAINDGIVSVTLGYAHPNTASNVDDRNRQITKDALIAANAYVDFSQFDTNGNGVLSATELHIIIVVAGYERSYTSSPCGPSVWGHRWGLGGAVSAPVLDGKTVGQTYAQFGENHCSGAVGSGHEATIGIMAHELGHDIGLPDLYDTDGSSQGIGNWSIMAGGSWGGVTNAGDSPSHFDPWSKYFEGWISPIMVNGTLVSEPIGQSATTADYYQFLPGTPTSGEYFLIENRQKANYDMSVPGPGLLIWHIDTSKSGNTAECYPGGPSCATNHYKIALLQADNLYNMEKNNNRGDAGDPWPGTSGKTVFDGASSPNSNYYNGGASGVSVSAIGPSGTTMTATLSTSSVDVTPPNTTITGGPLALTNLTNASFTFSSSEANSSFACKLDSGAFATCTSPISYSGLVAGGHTFQAQATDSAGNTDSTPANYNWTIDLTAPDTSIATGPSGTITTNSASFTWTGSDNISAPANLLYAYRLDPIEPSFSAFGGATTRSYTNLASGNYTFHVKAQDQATNQDLSPASRLFTVAAVTSITVVTPNGGETWKVNSRPTIQWSSSNVSGNVSIEISRNGGGSWTSITSSTANDGAHIWRVNKPATTSARIRVCTVAAPIICDVSDANFTIQ